MPKPNAAASRRGRSNGPKEEAPVGFWVGGRRREVLSCGTLSCMPIRSCKREQIQMKIAMQSCINPKIATHVSRFAVGYMASLDLYAVSVSQNRDGDRERQRGKARGVTAASSTPRLSEQTGESRFLQCCNTRLWGESITAPCGVARTTAAAAATVTSVLCTALISFHWSHTGSNGIVHDTLARLQRR
ncbi:hypothetical protein V8C44DRAFT_125785 [Trichoderma aethiopicum]